MKVEFVGYAADCVIGGQVALDSDRMTDLLSGRAEYEVAEASLEALDDERVVEAGSVTVLRDDLCAVAATGPRGDARRRVRTRPFPIRAQVGPYEVFGYIHALPTADPVSTALRRAFIPMTGGWIRFRRGGQMVERAHEGMLLNRTQVEWLQQASNAEAQLPAAPEMRMSMDPRARDLTHTPVL